MREQTGAAPAEAGRLSPCEQRQKSRITLDQIAESTKICRRHLEAIESGDYAQLPGGVFARSYIRQYATAIGYSADLILERYRLSLEHDTGASQQAAAAPSRWVRFFSFS